MFSNSGVEPEDLVPDFLASRRQFRLTPVRTFGPWEEQGRREVKGEEREEGRIRWGAGEMVMVITLGEVHFVTIENELSEVL